ncbi:hypothetical protein OCU04_012795 [Sclerotinia nivalis]|uniref:Uncharacterized protein n=1 Tax=Sclerotinia nivalis TaxID=352851 RepID=A0A9X0AD50_9HELO|nr:hypothetical protein OCU04_012795 [Sclerotinia nivalis]
MPTKVRLFLLRAFSALPILQNGPMASPMSSTSTRDRALFGQQVASFIPFRTISEFVTIGGIQEEFILEIHEKEGKTVADFLDFITQVFARSNGRSNRDAYIIWGFTRRLTMEIAFGIMDGESQSRVLICNQSQNIRPFLAEPENSTCKSCTRGFCSHNVPVFLAEPEISTCNSCTRGFCPHRQYNTKFLQGYRNLLRTVKGVMKM